MDMFHYLTQDIKEPFLRPELVDRLAAMLNFNLKQLSGAKCKNLKVRNSEKYNWDPKWLLSHLVDIYIHLDSDLLAGAMANDQRSFSMETFQVSIHRSRWDRDKIQRRFRWILLRSNKNSASISI